MKKIVSFICALHILLMLISCNKDENSIVGVWKLTTWSVNIPVDLNNDGVITDNILNEVDCINTETLVFDHHGVVASNETFNPEIDIVLLDETNDDYFFNVVCSEGIIGTASSYTKEGDTIVINDKIAILKDDKLTRVFKNAYKIYNEDLTKVIDTKDLTLIYTKS